MDFIVSCFSLAAFNFNWLLLRFCFNSVIFTEVFFGTLQWITYCKNQLVGVACDGTKLHTFANKILINWWLHMCLHTI